MRLTDPTLFRQQVLIGGEWRDAADGAHFAVPNPANVEIVAMRRAARPPIPHGPSKLRTRPLPAGATRPPKPARSCCAAGST